MAPAHRWLVPELLLTLLFCAAAAAAPLPEPPVPDSASGAGSEAAPWPAALPAAARPERPMLVPQSVPVGDLALQPGPQGPAAAEPRPPAPLHYPLAVAASEQDPWGWRYSTARGAWRMHTGLDLIAPEGTAVLAVLAGRVQRVDVIDGYGLTLLIDHGGGWSSLYAHLLQATVQAGERVEAGQAVGLVGQSGNASTPHLHLELRQRQPQTLAAVDPTPLLPAPPAAAAITALTGVR